MFVAHLQIQPDRQITAKGVKGLIDLVERLEWPGESAEASERAEAAKQATDEARALKLIDQTASFVNCGVLADLVDTMGALNHEGRGMIVNTPLQTPTTFYVLDGMVRVPHINFDFDDYAIFEFGRDSLTLRGLTETDKTLLRLGNSPRRQTLDDGRVVERVRR